MDEPALLDALVVSVAGVSACQQSPAPSARVAAFAKLPDWSWLWEPNVFVGEGIGQSLSAEGLKNGAPILGAKMPLNAEWQAKFEAIKKDHDDAVAADPDHPPALAYVPCSAPPFLLGIISPTLSQWRITPEEVTFIDTIGFIRHVYTDGRAHPPAEELWATKMGDFRPQPDRERPVHVDHATVTFTWRVTRTRSTPRPRRSAPVAGRRACR